MLKTPTAEPREHAAHEGSKHTDVEEPRAREAETQKPPERAEMLAAAKRATEELEEKQRSVPAPAAPAAAPPAAMPTPEPVAPTPTPARPTPAAGGGKVTVPHTDHVSVDVPSGLQAWLDADTRMQPWVNDVIRVADRCYASARSENPNADGVIEVVVTMHKDDRPSADVKKVPGALGSVIACATGDLLRDRMPLFTGDEGKHYTVKIHFTR